MSLSQFYIPDLHIGQITIDEDTSRHMTGVLRMTRGDEVMLTDGKGTRAHAVITDDNRKRTKVEVRALDRVAVPLPSVAIAISLVKNAARFEWFLEKATEI